MTAIETVIRPFVSDPATPVPYTKPGQRGVAPVLVRVGTKGGTKTFNTHASFSASLYMGRKQVEKAPRSEALQGELTNLHSQIASAGTAGDDRAAKEFTDKQDANASKVVDGSDGRTFTSDVPGESYNQNTGTYTPGGS
jgi:hypothetical protein